MSSWVVIDSLYCAEQYFCSHLDSIGHYLREYGEGVRRCCLNARPEQLDDDPAWIRTPDAFGWGSNPCAFDVAFFLDGYGRAMEVLAKKRIAQVAAICLPMPWEVRKPDGSPAFDLVVSSIPTMVEAARAAGCRAEYQQLAFDLRARACMMGVKRDLDCIFIGTTGPNHKRRTELLDELKDVVTVMQPVFGREYFRTLASAKVVLNVHAEWASGAANAMRLYEGAGMGCAVVSDGDGGPVTFVPFNGTAANARAMIDSCLHGPQPADWGENWALSTETYECDDRIPQLIRWAKEV
jgi:hypothetical protein